VGTLDQQIVGKMVFFSGYDKGLKPDYFERKLEGSTLHEGRADILLVCRTAWVI
jgi:hypothetical protein